MGSCCSINKNEQGQPIKDIAEIDEVNIVNKTPKNKKESMKMVVPKDQSTKGNQLAVHSEEHESNRLSKMNTNFNVLPESFVKRKFGSIFNDYLLQEQPLGKGFLET